MPVSGISPEPIVQYLDETGAVLLSLDNDGNLSLGGGMQQVAASGTAAAAGVAATTYPSVSGPFTQKIVLSSANILALRATPLQLIAAPGAGKFIRILQLDAHNTFGTVAYTKVNANLKLFMGTTAGGFALTGDFDAIVDVAASQTDLAIALSELRSADANILNKAIFAGNDGAAEFLAGDGTVELYIRYVVVTL